MTHGFNDEKRSGRGNGTPTLWQQTDDLGFGTRYHPDPSWIRGFMTIVEEKGLLWRLHFCTMLFIFTMLFVGGWGWLAFLCLWRWSRIGWCVCHLSSDDERDVDEKALLRFISFLASAYWISNNPMFFSQFSSWPAGWIILSWRGRERLFLQSATANDGHNRWPRQQRPCQQPLHCSIFSFDTFFIFRKPFWAPTPFSSNR